MGIIADLSEWQGTVDFAKLSKVVDGVMLRVQSGYTHPDSRYKEYVTGCKANNIPFGTYAYFKGVSIPDSIAEAQSALERMDKDSKCFALDIEEVTCSDLVGAGQAFIDYLKNKGVQHVGLYAGEYFYNDQGLSAINADWHWIANYGFNDGHPHDLPRVETDLFQYTSVGKLDGICGNVDESEKLSGFTFLDKQVIVAPIMHVKALCKSDIRTGPSHQAGYIRDAQPGESFDVYRIVNKDGTQWHCVGGTPEQEAWIDGNNGQNLYWLDNPALKAQPVYYVIQSGDNLTNIAKVNGTNVVQLKTWNGIANENLIYPGQKIRVK